MTYDFSSRGNEYERILGKSHKYYLRTKCEELLKTLTRLNFHPEEVLDLGCGTGEAEEDLHEHFKRIVGVDLSQSMINEAKSKKAENCDFTLGDASKLSFQSNSFDVVFSFCLFHHLQPGRWASVMKEVKRVTKKGGMIVLCEHNPESPIMRALTRKSEVDENTTLVNSKQLKAICEACGIRVFQRKFIVFFPELLSFLNRIERYLFKIPFGGQYIIIGLNT
jgi:ubiquinone/menaquinone biosynthesis C-methylase UbiE